MMTPIYLNNPLPTSNSFPLADELKEEHDHHHHQHLKLFITPHHTADGSSCSSTFFNTSQDQRGESSPSDHHQSQQHEHKVMYNNFWHVESSDHQVLPSSSIDPTTTGDSFNGLNSSIITSRKPELNGDHDDDDSNNNNNNNRNGLTVKWMSSKMRLMRKMMTSNCAATEKEVRVEQQRKYQDHHHHHQQQQQQQQHSTTTTQINYFENGNNGIIRVCSNCNTTKTPLWRGGPSGPKSLCNACGIRQRKARRAMEAAAAAANGTVLDSTATDTSSSSSTTKSNYKVIIKKEKKSQKSRTNYCVAQYKKQCKALQDQNQDQDQDQEGLCNNNIDEQSTNKKLCFEDFALNLLSKNSGFQGVFPQDEEEGAILLMALSCDLV